MKKLITISLIFFLFSCSKQQETKPIRMGGALPDMPNSIPVLVSPSFNKAITTSVNHEVHKGKPNKAPAITFINPLNGATVSGIVNVSIKATDSDGIDSVSISINGQQASKTTSYTWNTTGMPSGFYWITAYARDATGQSRTTSITVSIKTTVVEPPQPASGWQVKPMPPVMDQGSEGSCVAFAVGYAARSVEYFNTTGNLKTFSPEHLFNQVKFPGGCSVGTAMQTALEFIMANGILPLSSMAYDPTNGCDLQPTDLQKAEALNYKIPGFHKIYTLDSAMIKAMVRMNKPVIISIVADNSFMNASGYFLWNQYSGSGSLGHSVVIYGYDDAKKAYKIFNSWGSSWGESGTAWIDYTFFTARTGTYCYAIK
jgi:hypothetical protein